jgi:hypothetical protein
MDYISVGDSVMAQHHTATRSSREPMPLAISDICEELG